MKKLFLLPLVILLFGSVALAQMETPSPMILVSGNVGYALPMGEFKDTYDGGIAAGASGCYMFNKMYGVELGAQWSKFEANDKTVDKIKADLSVDDAKINFQFVPVTLDFVLDIPVQAPVIPYVKAGVGLYFWTNEAEITGLAKETDSKNDFGFNGGLGVNIPVSETTLINIGAQYHYVKVDAGTGVETAKAQYATFSAGVGFMF